MTDTGPELDDLLTAQRPALLRYCGRMVGSVVDGEDVVQEALLKAVTAWRDAGPRTNSAGWLFRIAHNTALDHLRRRRRQTAELPDNSFAGAVGPERGQIDFSTASLRTFLQLPALQRSAVILKDVLGHSLSEIASITGASQGASKAALQRGRARLRRIEPPVETPAPALSEEVRARLTAYVDGFRLGDFDAVRSMLAEDVRLDLVAKVTRRGMREVAEYFEQYEACDQWIYAAGVVDGRPSLLIYDRHSSSGTPAHFATLKFEEAGIRSIHDFLFAPYAMEGVDMHRLPG